METYVALLRGINISGQKIIKMADLRELLEKAGLHNVQTYVQSGNIVFNHNSTSREELREVIISAIRNKYGYEVPTMVLQHTDLTYSIENNPFAKEPEKDTKRFFVTYLGSLPTDENRQVMEAISMPPEEFVIDGTIIFGYSPEGLGKAKITNNFFENKLKVKATTRNWNTVNKLAEMSKE